MREIALDAKGRTECRREILGIGKVEDHLNRRCRQPVALSQPDDARGSRPSCVVSDPVSGDLDDRLHRMIPAERRRRITREAEAHRGNQDAAGQEGEADPAPPAERQPGEGQSRQQGNGQV